MLKHVLLLLFIYGIKNGSSSPQEAVESKDIFKNGIKKNEVGANGLEANWEKVTKNFQNPVLEYLLRKSPERTSGRPGGGIVREIRHSQTLLLPNFLVEPLSGPLLNQLPQIESFFVSKQKQMKSSGSSGEGNRSPDDSSFDNFWNLLKNKTQPGGGKIQESVVSSPVLHLNKTEEGVTEEWTRIQTYPAVAVVINTYDKAGVLKSSVTHFQPDFKSFTGETNGKEATEGKISNIKQKIPNDSQYTISNYKKDSQNPFPGAAVEVQNSRNGITWPFPIVINDPFLSANNVFGTGMYNAVSSMVEYGPEADIFGTTRRAESENRDQQLSETKKIPTRLDRLRESIADSNVFDEVTMRSDSFKRKPINTKSVKVSAGTRKRRDATSIFVKSREGDTIAIKLEEPTGSNDAAINTPDERARSFSPVLVNTPPLSTILRPPQQGYADKKRKTKPSKPIKEEGNSEEVGEEHEEESTSVSQESANEGVAISPPPEGASVAEAKPIGLAIAGPGGVAASKPQGTAVAGPGGLAIARPVGTAIAGVEVEGSVPIGGQQKNKKKPKQEKEQTEGELHYVGGLTGPIGNPQPKEFADSIYYKTVKETEGNNIQENLFLRGRPNPNGFQLKLGQQNGKYGFIPLFANPGEGFPQKRADFPTFFHGLLGNNGQGFDQFQNFRTQF